jgi:hypothetical protein
LGSVKMMVGTFCCGRCALHPCYLDKNASG